MFFPIRTIIALLILVAIILLQVVLCKKGNKWSGLILPIISFGLSFLWVAGTPYYMALYNRLLDMILVFIVTNIPTAIFMAIYLIYRDKKKRISEIDKMNIQDLD